MADDNWLTRNSQGNPAANLNLRVGVEANPDEAADNATLARRFNLPPAAIEQDRALFKARAAAQDARDLTFDKPRTSQWLARSRQNAKIAHDDLGVLGTIESYITAPFAWARDNVLFPVAKGIDNAIMDETPARVSVPQVAKQAPSALASGGLKLLSGLAGVGRAASELDNSIDRWWGFGGNESLGSRFFRNIQRESGSLAQRVGPDYSTVTGVIGRGILGGLESVPTTFAALGTTLATGNPLLGASVGGLQQGGESYGRARDQGLGVGRSLLYGGIDAAVETGTEFLPQLTFLHDTNAGAPVLKRFIKNQLGEQLGEQTATALQDLNAWATLPENKDKTFGDYLAERPEAALNTAIQTLVVGGVANAGITALERAADLPAFRARREAREQALAAQHAGQLQELLAAAGQSKLRERDPVSFREFVDAQTEEGPLEHVYVDGKVLNQTLEAAGPEAAALLEAMPSVREQLAQAVETGGDVRIPTAELATALPGTAIEQQLVDHLRVDPLLQSAAEAREQASGAADRLQAGFEQQLGEQVDNAEFNASRDKVTQHFTEQLAGANRFTTDVNDRYASLLGSFYSVQAAKLGITPEQMLARYPLQVRAVDEATGAVNRLGQFVGTQALRLPNAGYETLKAAGARLRAGEDAETVRRETGWHEGDDGRLRFEISDDAAKLDVQQLGRLRIGSSTDRLGNILQHDQLFAAYPQLREMEVRVAREKSKVGAAFVQTPQGDYIQLNQGLLNRGDAKIRSVLLHEIQHAIQEAEGFASGGAPNEAQLRASGFGEQFDAEVASIMQDGDPWTTAGGLDEEGAKRAAALNLYTRLAGEIEARNTQAREMMTDEQRRETPPSTTQDVPPGMALFQGPPAGERLQGLPYRIKVDGVVREFGPFEPARDAARVYTEQAGLPYLPPSTYVKVDEERAKRIAQAFEDMPHDPTDPLVKASYDAMIRETLAQWQAIKATGLKVEFITGADPYGNPRNAILDVVENNHLWVFPTSEGFGGSESADVDISGNPLLATVPGEEISGRPVQANDIFRIVHDYFGHIKEGVGFRADGEENAWRSHSAMYSPLARMAMTTETRGQNSWVNYGPHAEFNKTANGAETQYAPQKIGLLPDWVVSEGAADPSPQPAERVLNSELAAWTPRHVEELIAKARPDQYVALMSPQQFLGLTASASGRAALAEGRGAVLDEKQLQGTTMGLVVDLPFRPSPSSDRTVPSNVRAHDGRGRMTALGRAGIERVPVLVTVPKGTPPPEGFDVAPQRSRMPGSTGDTPTNTGELIPLNEASRARLYALADEARVLFQKTRGYITFGQDVTAQPSTITLLNASDLSTFLHEAGHFFLEVQSHMAAQPGAPQEVVDDMATTLKWMGVEGGHAAWLGMTLEQKREHHEKFARGFEAYLFEGKAPSAAMRGVFQRFRAWLVSVYKNNIANLRAPLTDEIRGVFDRMLASTDAIRAAEADANVGPIFTEQPAGMTDVEWQEYQALGITATADAIDDLQARSLRDMRFAKRVHARELKRLKDAIAAQREQVEDEVRAELGSQPVYRAIEFLRRGTVDGQPVEGPTKFDVDAFNGLYEGYNEQEREAVKKQLGFGKYGMFSRTEGVNPAQVADLFGFSSADELVTALLKAPDLQTEIDAAVEQRMLERYGDINSPEALDAAASAAIHNEVRARFVATELGALERGVGKPRMLAKAARQFADGIVSRLKVREVRPAQYEAAERRAAAAAQKALKANDLATATAEKRNQLLNLYATKAARTAQDEVRKTIDYFRKFARKGTRDNIDPDYLDQIDAMLDRFELRTGVSDAQLARRKSLAEWIDRQRALGFEPAIDPELENEARRQSYRDLTMDEMRGLRDSIRNIEHLGRLKRELLKNKERRELAAAVEAGAAEIRDNAYKVKRQPIGARTWLERARGGVDEFFAIHRKFGSLIREMSGGRDGGVLWDLFTRPMNEAGGQEAVMTAEATQKLNDIFKRLRSDNTFKRVYEPAIDASISLETRLMVALNWGNATNRARVMDGEGWTQAQVEAVLAPLTEQHWQFVKDVWSHINSYWPEIAAKEKRVTGVEPEKVEAEPFTFTTTGGDTIVLPGGYFPIKYDPDKSSKAEADTAAEVQRQITQGLYTRASTRRGHTKARVDTVERSIRKDFGVIFEHNAQVIHDLSWHETLIDMNRLLGSGQIDEAIREHYGPAVVRVMRKTLEDIAVGGIPAQNVLERGVNYLRAGATVVGLGWNLMTSLFQPLGLTNSMVRIGPKYVGRGIARVFRDAASMEATTNWVYANSDFMRLRSQTQQREIAEIRQQFQAKGPVRSTLDRVPGVAPTLDAVSGSFFVLITKAQLIADVPTWAGAYEKAVDEGNAHERAVALADQAVIDSQGDGTIKDLAGVQRGGPFQKLWTNFYSWFNVAYNQLAESVNQTRRVGPERLPLLAVDFLLIAVVPALLTSLLRGAVAGDDWDELKKRIANDQASGYLGFMFGLRELGAAFGVGNGYSGPAGARAIDATIKLGKQAQQGEADEAFFKALNNAAGVLFHYPAGQVQRTYLGIEALADGKTKNPMVILTGPPPKK